MIDRPTGQSLLDAAIKWYTENGPAHIPKDGHLAGEETSNGIFYSGMSLYLSPASGNHLENIPARLFPVLAAISLGFDSADIAKIITHHDVKLWDVTGLSFANPSFTPIPLIKESLSEASGSRVHIEVIKAHDSTQQLRVDLLENASKFPSPQQSLAYTHAELSSLWPSVAIQLHARRIMSPTSNTIRDRFTAFDSLTAAPDVLSDFPDGDPLVLVRRSGMLGDIVQRKLTGKFSLWESALRLAALGYEAQLKIMDSLKDSGHLKTQALAVKGLLSSVSDAANADYEGDDVLTFTMEFFKDAPDFDRVLQSSIFKLNTISLCDYPNELNAMERLPNLYDGMIDSPHLLSRVANEILARPAIELGYSDFLSLIKLSRMKLPAQAVAFNPERLINHVVAAVTAFVTPNNILCRGKLGVDSTARDSIMAIAGLIPRYHNLNYDELQLHSEASKVLLIKGGLDVRRFTGLTREARGEVLEHELGL